MSTANVLEFSGAAVRPVSRVRAAMTVAAAGVAAFVAQGIGITLWVPGVDISTIWVPGGVMLAVALLTAPRQWPALILAMSAGSAALFVALHITPLFGGILLGLAAGIHTIALAAILRAVLRGRPLTLGSHRELLSYLVVVVVGGAAVVSVVFITATSLLALRPATFLVWRTFALAAVLGYLTVTPTMILLAREAERRLHEASAGHLVELGLLGLLLALACGLIFVPTTHPALVWSTFAMTLPALLLWAASRFGALGASTSLLIVTIISTLSTIHGLGPFAGHSSGENTLLLQLFFLGLGVPLLALGVVLGEQERTTAALLLSQIHLRQLNSDLLSAREKEAARIARELHDDVGQRLALLSIGLSRARRAAALPAAPSAQDAVLLQEQLNGVARSIRELSHQLYPAELEHVGLASALQSKCEEIQRATGLTVRLTSDGVLPPIPRDLALCLFRVAQEALSNVIRHSGAGHVDVTLRCIGRDLQLEITDDGRGMAHENAERGHGLGLYSVAERIRAVGGTMRIESAPGRGTTVCVEAPTAEAPSA